MNILILTLDISSDVVLNRIAKSVMYRELCLNPGAYM